MTRATPSSDMATNFSLFTSLRYDIGLKQVPSSGLEHAGWNYKNESPLYMLDFHRDRLLRAATHWQWKGAINVLSGEEALTNLAQLAEAFVGPDQVAPLRLRIVVTHDGDITFAKFDTPAKSLANLFPEQLPPPGVSSVENDHEKIPQYVLLHDNEAITRSEYTHFKTTKREMYDAARKRMCIGPTDNVEVLLINQDGFVMEGSNTTPYFWRDGKWVTPPVSGKFSLKDGSGGQDGTSRRWAINR